MPIGELPRWGFGLSPAPQGKFEYWVAALKPGVVIFELDVESEEQRLEATRGGWGLRLRPDFSNGNIWKKSQETCRILVGF